MPMSYLSSEIAAPALDATPDFGVTDTLVMFGDAVKALDESGRFGGMVVRFGDETTPDLSKQKDFFNSDTQFNLDVNAKAPVIFHHGLDATLDLRRLAVAEIKAMDAGLWCEGVLNIRDDYERKIWDMIKDGKLGFSSGSSSHLVRREKRPNGTSAVKSWPICEVSLTPTPADPYLATAVVPIKSLIDAEAIEAAAAKALMAETGTGFAPPNPMASLRRSAVIGGLDRMNHATEAAVLNHLYDDKIDHPTRVANCTKCYDMHRGAAVKMIDSMMADDDDGDELKSLVTDHVQAVYSQLTMTDHFGAVHDAAATLVDRLTAYAALKSADGHPIPAPRLAAIGRFRDTLADLVASAEVKAVPPTPDVPAVAPDDGLDVEVLAALAFKALTDASLSLGG